MSIAKREPRGETMQCARSRSQNLTYFGNPFNPIRLTHVGSILAKQVWSPQYRLVRGKWSIACHGNNNKISWCKWTNERASIALSMDRPNSIGVLRARRRGACVKLTCITLHGSFRPSITRAPKVFYKVSYLATIAPTSLSLDLVLFWPCVCVLCSVMSICLVICSSFRKVQATLGPGLTRAEMVRKWRKLAQIREPTNGYPVQSVACFH